MTASWWCDIGAVEMRNNLLVAAVLPSSRSVEVGTPATAFVTIINTGSESASNVGVALAGPVQATLDFRPTDAVTNQVTGTLNMPVDIAAGSVQTFVIGITPTEPFAAKDVVLAFSGSDAIQVDPLIGVNTLRPSASTMPVPDVIAVAATPNRDGIVSIPTPPGTAAFALATVNLGTSAIITASADTGSANLPLDLTLCETNPADGACFGSIAPAVTTEIGAGATPTFAIFAAARGAVPFDPAMNRVFVRFRDADGVTRGSTSVAVYTP